MTGAFVFTVIGQIVVALVVLALIAVTCLLIWGRLIHERFHWVPFRKGARRLSVASWHNSRIVVKKSQAVDDGLFSFDDWPVNERPFYLSYQFGRKQRRVFVLFGIMEPPRRSVGKGKHP